MFQPRWQLCVLAVALAFSAAPSVAGNEPPYPLEACTSAAARDCFAQLVVDANAVQRRDLAHFPQRYLELWNQDVRKQECARLDPDNKEKDPTCLDRLAALSDYFNPRSTPHDAVGVALEGGGSKAAPFALGVLAGLYEAKLLGDTRVSAVQAVSSVSGGSYAASYLYNRLYDQHADPATAGTIDRWFASCVPSEYTKPHRPLAGIGGAKELPECKECREGTCTGPFDGNYAFMGQVWSNPDLLFPMSDKLNRADGLPAREIVTTGILFVPTLATVPLQFVARSVFRLPFNVAPSKWAYRYGLERQFGFSPSDWSKAIQKSDGLFDEVDARNHSRTLDALGKIENAPLWIINASSPGGINVGDWFLVRPRDPLRLNFELTPGGYGSGTYGYAKRPPESPMRLDTLDSWHALSIGDATLVSGAFFDSEQVRENGPTRLPIAALLHGLNLTWFSEIRNFNVASRERVRQEAAPWPFWGLSQEVDRQTPYIHLHDGGNSENTGIFALLRRGYRTIVYAHATDDRDARFEAICHLKNQLELDGTYAMKSAQLDEVLATLAIAKDARKQEGQAKQLVFANHLDELCTRDLVMTYSAQVTFGVPDGQGGSRLSRLVCRRLQKKPDGLCAEYFELFPEVHEPRPDWPPDADKNRDAKLRDLFFRWPALTLTFTVQRDCEVATPPCKKDEWMSTIYAALPAMSDKALARQTRGAPRPVESWDQFCALDTAERAAIRVNYCRGPGNGLFTTGEARGPANDPSDLPCTSLAHVVLNGCPFSFSSTRRPHFPQHHFARMTWNSSYTLFAAYFDLGRDWALRIRDTMCTDAAASGEPCKERTAR